MTHALLDDNPTERQLALAFIAALRKKARQPGPVPDYIPDSLRGWVLRMKTRHSFSTGART